MDKAASRNDELTDVVRAILLVNWDPIRIQDLPIEIRRANHDEYDCYVETVVRMIMDRANEAALAKYLHDVETQAMGVKPGNSRAAFAAQALFAAEEGFAVHE
jgi:hypothetical protein